MIYERGNNISDTFRSVLNLHLEKHGANIDDIHLPIWPQPLRLAIYNAIHESGLFCNEVAAKVVGCKLKRINSVMINLSGHNIDLLVNKV